MLQRTDAECLRGYGGIGRRGGFRSRWATMQVQVLLAAFFRSLISDLIFSLAIPFFCQLITEAYLRAALSSDIRK